MADTKTPTPEEQVKELQTQLATAQAGHKAAEAAKAKLAEENTDLKKAATGAKDTADRAIADKDAQIASLRAENEKKDKAIAKLQTLVQKAVNDKESSATVNAEEKPVPIPMDIITVDEEKVRFRKPFFMLPGDTTVYKAEEAVHDLETIRKLLAIKGQTALEKIA